MAAGGGGEEAGEEGEDLSAGSAQPCDQYDNPGFITVINSSSSYWRIQPSSLTPCDPERPHTRMIRGGPLIDLPRLQTLLKTGQFDLDNVWFATSGSERDRTKYRWSTADVLQMFVCLDAAQDFHNAEWCDINGGRTVPCDAYVMRYDTVRQQRHRHGTEIYLKFSLDEHEVLSIVLVSCHPSR